MIFSVTLLPPMMSFDRNLVAVFFLFLLAGCVTGNTGDAPSGSASRRYTDPGIMWAP
jgi:hypothetical protein